jgi:glycosyltransferase involved in cell wall biosynthesis
MIKVLIVSTVGLGLYGITNSIMNYYRAMDKSDMQIDFLSPNEIPKNIRVEIKSNGGRVYEKIMRNNHLLKYRKQLAKIIKSGQYDIVHAHGNSNTLAIEMKVAKMCGVKVRIAHCHNSTCDHMFMHKLLKHLFDNSYTHGFACSKKAGKWLFGKKSFTVINNGIPVIKFFYNEKDRKEYRMKLDFENNKVIGHVGHFSYQKNHEFLIKIFSEIYKQDNSYRLLLIGDGDLRDEIKNQLAELDLEDVVCMYGETLDVSKLLQAMDIFVFPSRFEGFGMAVIEAQSAGLPCVVSDAVPFEAKLIKQLKFVHLNDSMDTWINKILEMGQIDRVSCSEKNSKLVQNSNYNIMNEAGKLKNLYYSYVLEK